MKHVATKNERDRQMIEALIWRFGPLSGAEIHELTDLRRSEISRVVRELLSEGRVLLAGRADNPMGRKRVPQRLNAEQAFVLGVGFDDQDVVAAVMDLQLTLRSQVSEPACLKGGTEGLANQLLTCAGTAVREAAVDPHPAPAPAEGSKLTPSGPLSGPPISTRSTNLPSVASGARGRYS
jgi:hypothetical protein